MKIKISMKNPDCIADALDEAAKPSAATAEGLSDGEREELVASRREKLAEEIKQWVEYEEYITIEIDTEARTAIVCDV